MVRDKDMQRRDHELTTATGLAKPMEFGTASRWLSILPL
jgi:hypothetical protein